MKAPKIINMKHIAVIIILLLLSVSVQAQTFFTDSGEIVFTSKVPLHTFQGSSNKLVGMIKLNENILDFYLDLETLDTGNGKRDKDMLLTLETKEYPFAEFYGKISESFNADSDQPQPVTAIGSFKLHGISQEVEIQGILQKTTNGLQLNANWILNLDDYDIEPPKLLLIKVDENQEIALTAFLKPYKDEDQ